MTEQEKSALAQSIQTLSKEIRRSRRAAWFKRFIFIAIFGGLFFSQWRAMNPIKSDHPKVAIIDVKGLIADGEMASAEHIIGLMNDVLEDSSVHHIVLNIDSGGGSPVQSARIYRAIRALPENLGVTAVISDTGASGAYYIASAADYIYADPSSIVGSIGVISGQFGVRDVLNKIGVEARTFTAGEHKDFLSSTEALREDEVKHMQALLDDMHAQFIDDVKAGRGERLSDHPDLFSGLFWTGRQAKELGLVDDLKSIHELLDEQFADDEVVYYTPKLPFWQQLQQELGQSLLKIKQSWAGQWQWY